MNREEVLDKLARGRDVWFKSVRDELPTWLRTIAHIDTELRVAIPDGCLMWVIHEEQWRDRRIELGLEKKVEEEAVVVDVQEDTGAHYRYSHRAKVSQADADRGYVDVKLDPYRICSIYQVGGGPREHIVKKGLRGLRKGDTELGLIKQLRDALDRWEEMVKEDCQ